jgi:hypothetical protein
MTDTNDTLSAILDTPVATRSKLVRRERDDARGPQLAMAVFGTPQTIVLKCGIHASAVAFTGWQLTATSNVDDRGKPVLASLWYTASGAYILIDRDDVIAYDKATQVLRTLSANVDSLRNDQTRASDFFWAKQLFAMWQQAAKVWPLMTSNESFIDLTNGEPHERHAEDE